MLPNAEFATEDPNHWESTSTCDDFGLDVLPANAQEFQPYANGHHETMISANCQVGQTYKLKTFLDANLFPMNIDMDYLIEFSPSALFRTWMRTRDVSTGNQVYDYN